MESPLQQRFASVAAPGAVKTGSPSNTAAVPAVPRPPPALPRTVARRDDARYAGDGKRDRRKVSGQTKPVVVDKLRDLHKELDKGTVPKTGYVHYTVRQAAQDWLATGLDGRLASRAIPRRASMRSSSGPAWSCIPWNSPGCAEMLAINAAGVFPRWRVRANL